MAGRKWLMPALMTSLLGVAALSGYFLGNAAQDAPPAQAPALNLIDKGSARFSAIESLIKEVSSATGVVEAAFYAEDPLIGVLVRSGDQLRLVYTLATPKLPLRFDVLIDGHVLDRSGKDLTYQAWVDLQKMIPDMADRQVALEASGQAAQSPADSAPSPQAVPSAADQAIEKAALGKYDAMVDQRLESLQGAASLQDIAPALDPASGQLSGTLTRKASTIVRALPAITEGDGPKELWVFFDGNCEFCQTAEQLLAPSILAGSLRVHWIPVSAIGGIPSELFGATMLAAKAPPSKLLHGDQTPELATTPEQALGFAAQVRYSTKVHALLTKQGATPLFVYQESPSGKAELHAQVLPRDQYTAEGIGSLIKKISLTRTAG